MIYEKTNLYSISISSLQRDRLALLQGASWRGEEGGGGIGNWKSEICQNVFESVNFDFFFFFQAYPKQRRKITKQPRLICHKLFFADKQVCKRVMLFFFKFASLILVPQEKKEKKTSMIKNANVLWFGTEN